MAAGNNGHRPADVPPWAWALIQEGRRHDRQAAEDRKQATEDRKQFAEFGRQAAEYSRQAGLDRKQAAEDRKQFAEFGREAAEDRKLMLAHQKRLEGILDEIRQSNYDMKAVIVRSNDMHGVALERLELIHATLEEMRDGTREHSRMLKQILAALKVGGNGRGGNGGGNGHGRR